jgi:hypothetical protein
LAQAMRPFRIGIVCGAFALFALHATTAAAAGPSAALLLGEGFKDGYNFGIGVRGGFTLPMSLYLGGTFVYHLGSSEGTLTGDVKDNLFYFGAEGGYELSAGPLTVRPYLGLGYANVMATRPPFCIGSVCGPSTSNSAGKGTFWPGVTAIFPIGNLFVGGDLRYVILLDADDANAFSLFATGGTTF